MAQLTSMVELKKIYDDIVQNEIQCYVRAFLGNRVAWDSML